MYPKLFDERTFKFFQDYQKTCTNPQLLWADWFNTYQIYQKWFNELAEKPQAIPSVPEQAYQEWVRLLQEFQQKISGLPVSASTIEDKRFSDADWQEQPLFYFYHQAYLLWVKQAIQWIEAHESQDPKLKKQISFFTKQYLDAIAPSNFPLTNPVVFKQTLASQGENVRKGLQNWAEDLLKSPSHWQIQMTNSKTFELGRNIAITKGKVVFQNRLMQLIQYEPTTPTVYQKPLLMVPPWINKYYILDLNEKKSLVKWLVDQGMTVFMISWVNPDKSYQDVCFEDYLSEGILAAFDAITKATNEKSINALGFCIGGTLLAVASAYLKAKKISTIASATFLTSLIDFSEPGDIGVFIDETQIKNIEQKMALDGYLDGRAMMSTFNLLRVNDLQWSYYINNYLQGKKPIAFDLLVWNSDPSNLPAKMHSYYLRNFYLENRLCVPNALTVLNEKLNLNNVDIPCYFFSASQDHIAPWQSTFMGAKCFNGNVTFVLGGSGHIAGVVNPPNQNKYGYRSSDADIKAFSCAQEWLKGTTTHEGSWWLHWGEWLKMHAGNKVKPRIPGQGRLKIIQDAPGDYVRKKID